jgi:hypothetical protein
MEGFCGGMLLLFLIDRCASGCEVALSAKQTSNQDGRLGLQGNANTAPFKHTAWEERTNAATDKIEPLPSPPPTKSQLGTVGVLRGSPLLCYQDVRARSIGFSIVDVWLHPCWLHCLRFNDSGA